MADNLIQVGAVVDLGQYKAGMQEAVATTEATTRQMSVAFEKHAAASHEAVGGIKLAFEDAGIALNRHVARWLAAVPVLGAAAGAIFPVVAIFSFIESLSKADEKVDSHVEKMAKASRESLDLALSFDKQAESIQIANLKLEDHIATLQRTPAQNGVAIAALEAKRSLDELIKSFADAIAKEKELLATEKQGFLDRLLHGDSGINDVLSQVDQFNEKILDATTKFRLIARDGNKQQTAEAKAELDKQVADYRAFLNAQIAVDDALRQKKIQQIKDDTEAINKENNLRLTSAQFEDQISRNVAAANREYDKRDQTLRSLLILIKDENAAEEGISKHAALVAEESVDAWVSHAMRAHSALTVAVKKFYEDQAKAGVDADRALAESEEKRIAKITAAEKAAALAQERISQIVFEAARAHEAALGQLAEQRLNFELQIGKISQKDYEKQLQAQLAETYANERAKLELKRQAAQGNLQEQAKVDAQLQQLDDKYYAASEKAEQQSLLRRRQKFDQHFQQLTGEFNTAINSWIQGTETAGQAFAKMFDSIIGDLIGFVEKWIEHKIEMWLQDRIIGEAAQVAQIATHNLGNATMAQSDAFLAAANALATVPFPENIPVSTEMLSLGTGFAISAASFAVGTNFVPQDGLAYLHKGEKVIPASQQGPAFSGGITVVVNHSVNAVDAESFKAHIKRHGNMIGNEVARVLKRKGIK